MTVEYEVYSPDFDPYLEPIVCLTLPQADEICTKLREISGRQFGTSCSWQVREVEVGKRPMPPQAEVATPVLVDELRKLMAKHGQSWLIAIAWDAKTNNVNVSTCGSSQDHSLTAYELAHQLAGAMGCDTQGMTSHEDRRHEHLHVPPEAPPRRRIPMKSDYYDRVSELPDQVNINKLLCHRDTTIGSRLYQRGCYYLVTGEGGKGVGEHWICTKDTNQKES